MIFGSTFPRLRNRIPFHFKPLNFRRHGAYLGIKSLLSLRKISKIIISKINFQISNSRKIAKIENFLIRNIFDPFTRKIVIQNLRHDSALSLFPPKHMGVRLALGHVRLLLVIVSAFLGLVYPSSRFKRSFSV